MGASYANAYVPLTLIANRAVAEQRVGPGPQVSRFVSVTTKVPDQPLQVGKPPFTAIVTSPAATVIVGNGACAQVFATQLSVAMGSPEFGVPPEYGKLAVHAPAGALTA